MPNWNSRISWKTWATLHLPCCLAIFSWSFLNLLFCPLFKAHNKFHLSQEHFCLFVCLFFLVFFKLLCTHHSHLLFSFLMTQSIILYIMYHFVSPILTVSSLRIGAVPNYLSACIEPRIVQSTWWLPLNEIF